MYVVTSPPPPGTQFYPDPLTNSYVSTWDTSPNPYSYSCTFLSELTVLCTFIRSTPTCSTIPWRRNHRPTTMMFSGRLTYSLSSTVHVAVGYFFAAAALTKWISWRFVASGGHSPVQIVDELMKGGGFPSLWNPARYAFRPILISKLLPPIGVFYCGDLFLGLHVRSVFRSKNILFFHSAVRLLSSPAGLSICLCRFSFC